MSLSMYKSGIFHSHSYLDCWYSTHTIFKHTLVYDVTLLHHSMPTIWRRWPLQAEWRRYQPLYRPTCTFGTGRWKLWTRIWRIWNVGPETSKNVIKDTVSWNHHDDSNCGWRQVRMCSWKWGSTAADSYSTKCASCVSRLSVTMCRTLDVLVRRCDVFVLWSRDAQRLRARTARNSTGNVDTSSISEFKKVWTGFVCELPDTIIYMKWRLRHSVWNTCRRHVGGILCCCGVTS